MMSDRLIRFEIRFAAAAFKEYQALDNSVARIVDKKLEDLEERADELGKSLSGDLVGFKEIKLRDAGVRMIYQITDEKVDILTLVYVLAIGKRADGRVFKSADHRVKKLQEFRDKGFIKY